MESVIGRYTQGSRKEALSSFRSEALAADASNDVAFQEILSMCRGLLEMPDKKIADELLVSRPTVSRWVSGKNLPHRAMRKPILDWIAGQAGQRLRVLEAEERRIYSDPPAAAPVARVARAR